jgi:dTDP-4-amino-4,6-dideoxygalactose transaminase
MTTGGEGGMVTTNNERLWKIIWSYKDHGKSYDAVYRRSHQPGFRWLHESFGTNWRLTEMQSSIGRIQLRKLSDWVSARRRNAAVLNDGLADVAGLRLTLPADHIGHAYYKYYLFLESRELRPGWDRQRIMETVSAEGIPCFSGGCPEIYLEKAFNDARLGPPERLQVARRLGETSLMFLVHPTLSQIHMNQIVRVVRKIMAKACS